MLKESFDQYQIIRKIKDGGMGSVFLACQKKDIVSRPVVIKTLKEEKSQDPYIKTLFQDEVRTSMKLVHEGIAKTIDCGSAEGVEYVVLEYCHGKSISQIFKKLKEKKLVLPGGVLGHIFLEIAKAMSYAHTFRDPFTNKDLKIIHRDLTPQNIMITYHGNVKVIDFGIAKSLDNQEVTKTGLIKGKLGYVAPEYLEGNLTQQSDIFSLGVLMWELSTLKRLFSSRNKLENFKEILSKDIPSAKENNKFLNPVLDKIILKATQRDKRERYQTMLELVRELEHFVAKEYPKSNPNDIRLAMIKLFEKEITEEESALNAYGIDKVDRNLSEDEATKKTLIEAYELGEEHLESFEKETFNDLDSNDNDLIHDKDQTKTLSHTKTFINEEEVHTNIEIDNNNSDQKFYLVGGILASLVVIFLGLNHYREYRNEKDRQRREFLEEANKKAQAIRRKKEGPSPSDLIPKYSPYYKAGTSIRISNYDPRFHRVYINSKEVRPSYLKTFPVPIYREFVLRVTSVKDDEPVDFVKKIKIDKEIIGEIELPDFKLLKKSPLD
ncbi:MAG: serine/threonine protein kinase [Oligoflexia bacterium]|nr:serine/threonine protein kinase [Oligoflexia bacterium]